MTSCGTLWRGIHSNTAEGEEMQKRLSIFLLAAFGAVSLFAAPAAQNDQSGSSAAQDMKDAGHATENAAKKTGKSIKNGTKKAAKKTKHGVKKGVNKTAGATESGANKVEQKTDR
jgi:hypothetical protein